MRLYLTVIEDRTVALSSSELSLELDSISTSSAPPNYSLLFPYCDQCSYPWTTARHLWRIGLTNAGSAARSRRDPGGRNDPSPLHDSSVLIGGRGCGEVASFGAYGWP